MKVIHNTNTYWYEGNIEDYRFLHREDGPAIEWFDGRKDWYCHGSLHREGGPAVEWADGSYHWFKHGKLHREDGPAAYSRHLNQYEWRIDNKKLNCSSQEEFEKLIRLKAFW